VRGKSSIVQKTKPSPGSAEDWLARARGDLALAKAPLPEGAFYEDLCFHAQQAAEKALKAVYQHRGWTFQYTHDLGLLISGLRGKGMKVASKIDDSVDLTTYATESRYPGLGEPVTIEEYHEALRLAEVVVAWAQERLRRRTTFVVDGR
jgi:HEPN domain-containing protein